MNQGNMQGTTDIVQVLRQRATMYGLLGRIFQREVDNAFLAELRAMRYPQNTGNAAFDEAFAQLYRFMRHARENVLDVLAVDYARTFLGSGILNGNAAFPYESVYTSEHALLMQAARDQVLAIYRTNRLDASVSWNDPEDHLALELEFMRVMCERTATALESQETSMDAHALVATQYAFLKRHLLPWVPRFCLDVKRFSTTDFYHGAVTLTEAFLNDDAALLENMMDASGIDRERALQEAAAADEAVTAEMTKEAERDHLEPTVIATPEGELKPIASTGNKGE